MVDFNKLRGSAVKAKITDPLDIFRRMPKPAGINDLYTSQAEVLQLWAERRNDKDIVIKLHTGGGKTLVGLLMAQSTINESSESVLYLTPTVQLVNQTLEKAKQLGIQAAPYERGQNFPDEFVNGTAVLVGTYKSLFNGKSRFKLRGNGEYQKVGAVILDDAHAAFSELRQAFTLEIELETNGDLYREIAGLFRQAFKDSSRLGTFDDILSQREATTLEVPYWAWFEKVDVVRELLRAHHEKYALVWPLLRDHLHLCHAIISRNSFTITPILPLVDLFPTFADAPRRIYMSATIADDSEIVRTFDADEQLVRKALRSRSLAGISERMILTPDLMHFAFNVRDMNADLLKWTANEKKLGAVLLTPSDKKAASWNDVGMVATGSAQVEKCVRDLQTRSTNGPIVFSNRYDGIDLPNDACRLLCMIGLPSGTSNYELFRSSALYGGHTITRMLAQRIEQGIGRGARGAGDHCAVVLSGSDLSAWLAKDANFKFLTSATRAQIKIGNLVTEAIENKQDIFNTVERCFNRDSDWIEFHAEELAELIEEDEADQGSYLTATAERKAFNNWRDGYAEKAIGRLEKLAKECEQLDNQTQGWIFQLAARIADHWGNKDLSEIHQHSAYAKNKNLLRPRTTPPYRLLTNQNSQSLAIATQIGSYRMRAGFIQHFEQVVSNLHHQSTANQFEQALAELGKMIGLTAERHDSGGVGPDVLWLLHSKVGFVIEAKSRKEERNAFTKEQHGQLLVADEWFKTQYIDHTSVRVSVHPTNYATEPAAAESSYALTYDKLQLLISDARALLKELCESQLKVADLQHEAANLLSKSNINADKISQTYFQSFKVKN